MGHGLPDAPDEKPLLHDSESANSNLFLPNVHNVKHNVSEKMAQVGASTAFSDAVGYLGTIHQIKV